MKPKKIETWNTNFSLDYRIWQRNEETYFISTTKVIATKFLISIFGENPDEDDRLTFSIVRELWNIGKVRAAEYAKHIIDASISGVLSQKATAIAMSILTEQVGFLYPSEFLTERLVGKKRLQYWKENFEEKYSVSYEDPTIYAVLNMWGNGHPDLLAFIEENRKTINYIIRDCEY